MSAVVEGEVMNPEAQQIQTQSSSDRSEMFIEQGQSPNQISSVRSDMKLGL